MCCACLKWDNVARLGGYKYKIVSNELMVDISTWYYALLLLCYLGRFIHFRSVILLYTIVETPFEVTMRSPLA